MKSLVSTMGGPPARDREPSQEANTALMVAELLESGYPDDILVVASGRSCDDRPPHQGHDRAQAGQEYQE
jgi:hypothetical protein